ncbi:MAG: hypothetical protein E6G34_01860 [Actinobacteria bacterium]|nr:MAG: hypothetical protein E6G34_01860 [Actinomycetota bacterium]
MSTLGIGRRRAPPIDQERAFGHEPAVFNHPRAWQAAGVVALFVCFFALGRTTSSPSTSEFAAPAVLSAGTLEAVIPASLAGGSPLAPLESADVTTAWSSPQVARRVVHPRIRSAPRVSPAVVSSAPAAHAPSRTYIPPQSSSPPPSPAPAPSTRPSRPAPRPPAKASQPPAGGGSSFDSSG